VATLSFHQSKRTDHDRLGFHPDCPACRQDRLFGVVSPRPVFSYRLRVLLATGVLALSAGAASSSVASEPDRDQEGVAVPEQGSSPAPGNPSGESPGQATDENATDENAGGGGEPPGDELGQGSSGETALPTEVGPVLGDPQDDPYSGAPDGEDEPVPLEPQPAEDPDGGLGLADPDAPDAIDVEGVPVPPTEADPPLGPSPPVAPPVDVDGQPEPSDGTPPPAPHGTGRHGHEGDHGADERRAQERRDHTAPAPPATAPPPADPPLFSAPAPAESPPTVEPAPPPPGVARFHVVESGESLWSIAADLLGPGASPAAIASEVHRLWELNEARIGTGDPDLLAVGVKLRLR
jgi:hypothetical protein